jgi:hypothetical protein
MTYSPLPEMVTRICRWCKDPFQARVVDVKRGWGLFCCKRCKALSQSSRTRSRIKKIAGRNKKAVIKEQLHHDASFAEWDALAAAEDAETKRSK